MCLPLGAGDPGAGVGCGGGATAVHNFVTANIHPSPYTQAHSQHKHTQILVNMFVWICGVSMHPPVLLVKGLT